MFNQKFSFLRHAVKMKHEIEFLEVDILEFLELKMPEYLQKSLIENKTKELNEKKIMLLRYVEQNNLQEIIFKK